MTVEKSLASLRRAVVSPRNAPVSARNAVASPRKAVDSVRMAPISFSWRADTSSMAVTLVEIFSYFCTMDAPRSEEHTSELQSLAYLVCRLLLEKKKKVQTTQIHLEHRTAHKEC